MRFDIEDLSDISSPLSHTSTPQANLVFSPTRPISVHEVYIYSDDEEDSLTSTSSESEINNEYNVPILRNYQVKGEGMTLFIVFWMILMYLINAIMNKNINNGYNHLLIFSFKSLSDFPQCKPIQYEIWRLGSNFFLHKNLGHLFGNTLVILISGVLIENNIGKIRTFAIFISGVIGGNLIAAYNNRFILILGASGGAMALTGSVLANGIINFESFNKCGRLVYYTSALVPIGLDLLFYHVNHSENTLYISHWIGYLNGFLLGIYYIKPFKESKWKIYFQYSCLSLYILLNLYLLFDFFYFSYKTTVLNNSFQSIDYQSSCYEIVKNRNK